MELPVALRNRQIVDARIAKFHQAVGTEFPVFVAVGAKPLTAVVVPFVGVPDGDAVVGERPQFLDQPIVEFLGPLALQKFDYVLSADRKFGSIAPAALFCIAERHTLGIAPVPGVFRHPNLLSGRLPRIRRQRWSCL
jgi:hypothetical protein